MERRKLCQGEHLFRVRARVRVRVRVRARVRTRVRARARVRVWARVNVRGSSSRSRSDCKIGLKFRAQDTSPMQSFLSRVMKPGCCEIDSLADCSTPSSLYLFI